MPSISRSTAMTPTTPDRRRNCVAWVLQIIGAFIFVWAGMPKLFGAAESKELFAALGVEPAGRIATGLTELIAALLLVVPRTACLGGAFGVVLMIGALLGHVVKLGFAGPYGAMAGLAFVVLLLCGGVFLLRRPR